MFILFTKKQKRLFVNGIVDSVKYSLLSSGRKMSVSTELNLRFKLFKLVKLTKKDISSLNVGKEVC